MHGAIPRELVLEHPNSPANIQVREVRRARFPRRCPHGVQQSARGAARAAPGVRAQVLPCPLGIEHPVVVLTLTARHDGSYRAAGGVLAMAAMSEDQE